MNIPFRPIICLLFATALISAPKLGLADEDLAKRSQNPISDLISLPFENNTTFSEGPEDATVNTLNLKPVYPVNLGDWNLINRGVFPVIYQGERIEGEGSEFGLGDFTYQGFLSPAEPGPIIWGIGPALVFPTHTDDRLGADKWSAGPAFVALTTPGPWVFGALAQHVWSYAGDDDENNINSSLLQYFVNYNFGSGWYLTSTPIIKANWDANSGDRWTVPFGGGVGRLIKIGNQPIDLKGQVFWNAEKPDGTSDLAFQFQVKFLFPK